MIAQDAGSAITGAARGDIFFGSGAAAGAQAGLIRHAGDWVVLLPNDLALPDWAAVGN
jgi:membrane-bound lytic murein transglycosylase A